MLWWAVIHYLLFKHLKLQNWILDKIFIYFIFHKPAPEFCKFKKKCIVLIDFVTKFITCEGINECLQNIQLVICALSFNRIQISRNLWNNGNHTMNYFVWKDIKILLQSVLSVIVRKLQLDLLVLHRTRMHLTCPSS